MTTTGTMNQTTVIKVNRIVDPPDGWRYGFPMVYDNPSNLSFKDWLLSKGYPKAEVDLAVNCSRWWVKEA